jgi:hypothetical protein
MGRQQDDNSIFRDRRQQQTRPFSSGQGERRRVNSESAWWLKVNYLDSRFDRGRSDETQCKAS